MWSNRLLFNRNIIITQFFFVFLLNYGFVEDDLSSQHFRIIFQTAAKVLVRTTTLTMRGQQDNMAVLVTEKKINIYRLQDRYSSLFSFEETIYMSRQDNITSRYIIHFVLIFFKRISFAIKLTVANSMRVFRTMQFSLPGPFSLINIESSFSGKREKDSNVPQKDTSGTHVNFSKDILQNFRRESSSNKGPSNPLCHLKQATDFLQNSSDKFSIEYLLDNKKKLYVWLQ